MIPILFSKMGEKNNIERLNKAQNSKSYKNVI